MTESDLASRPEFPPYFAQRCTWLHAIDHNDGREAVVTERKFSMLVLTRKCRQSVVVEGCGGAAERLTVTVLEISGARVKLGFDVAPGVPVHRQEVWERINGIVGAAGPIRRPAAKFA
jgi:carbon storage regulator CsrA